MPPLWWPTQSALHNTAAHNPLHLFTKTEKCEFHHQIINFLGYVVGPGEVWMEETKVHAVQDWLTSAIVKELYRFLGFVIFFTGNSTGSLPPLQPPNHYD